MTKLEDPRKGAIPMKCIFCGEARSTDHFCLKTAPQEHTPNTFKEVIDNIDNGLSNIKHRIDVTSEPVSFEYAVDLATERNAWRQQCMESNAAIDRLTRDNEAMQASLNEAVDAFQDCDFDITGKTLAQSIQVLKLMNKDLAVQVVDRGNSYKQAIQEIAVLQEKGQYFHDFCNELHLPNGVMQYRVDWLRSYIEKLKPNIAVGDVDQQGEESMTFIDWYTNHILTLDRYVPPDRFDLAKAAWDARGKVDAEIAKGHAEAQRNLALGMTPADIVAYHIAHSIERG